MRVRLSFLSNPTLSVYEFGAEQERAVPVVGWLPERRPGYTVGPAADCVVDGFLVHPYHIVAFDGFQGFVFAVDRCAIVF